LFDVYAAHLSQLSDFCFSLSKDKTMTAIAAPIPNPENLPTPKALMERYFTDLRIDNWSLQTIERRRFSIGRFIDWASVRSIDSVTEITAESLEAYRRSLYHHRNAKTDKPLNFSTQASYLAAVKHWLLWLFEQQWIPEQLDHKVKLPKEEHRLPADHLSLAEVGELLSCVDLTQSEGLRDRAILEVFYATGIRRSELVHLRLDDVQRQARCLSIRQGKGRRDRIVPLSDSALGWIEAYLQQVRPTLIRLDNKPTDVLFLTSLGNVFHPVVLSALVRRYLTAAGITKRGSCHILRHTAATHMLEGGADLRSIQTLLGHQRLNTTEIYTHVTIIHLRQVYHRTHPAAKQGKQPNPGDSDTRDSTH
jgi:integrase/recombinase XerD